MKIASLILGFCLIATFAFAGTSAEIISVEQDTRKSIVIWVQYKVDGIEVEYYENGSLKKIDGKCVAPFYMQYSNAVDKTPVELEEWVKVNIEFQCDNLIKAKFYDITNAELIASTISKKIGQQYSKEEAEVVFDIDNDGIVDKKWTVKTDGTYVEAVTP